jgi:hypothetical protein
MISVIKRKTDDEGEIRAMNKNARAGKQLPIWNINTNEADLYGIAYATNDQALMSGLSISVWKKNTKSTEEKRAIDDKYRFNPNMKYSMYRYLLEDYVISESYSPKRYSDTEKDAILKMLKAHNKSPLQEFVEYLEFYDPGVGGSYSNPADVNYELIHRYSCNSISSKESYEYVIETEFKRVLGKDKGLKMKAQTLQTEMATLGWTYGRKKIDGKAQRVFYRDPVATVADADDQDNVEMIV